GHPTATARTLAFNRTADVTLSNLLSGTGNLSKLGTNTLTLTGANTYSGTTTIAATGTLQIGAGGTAGQLGTGATTDSGSLVFNRSDALTVRSAIPGTGAGRQLGGRTTTLN